MSSIAAVVQGAETLSLLRSESQPAITPLLRRNHYLCKPHLQTILKAALPSPKNVASREPLLKSDLVKSVRSLCLLLALFRRFSNVSRTRGNSIPRTQRGELSTKQMPLNGNPREVEMVDIYVYIGDIWLTDRISR